MAKEALPQDLADFLVTKNFDPEYFDEQGQPTTADEAKTIKFDYVAGSGKNYGTAVCVISEDELSLFYGDNLGRGMEPEDKDEWYSFLEELSNQAASHSASWSPRDINQLKHTLAGIAAIKEGLFEGYYGTRKVSYMGEQTQARLVIQHNRVLGENDKRYRYVESLFIETADQERFRLSFKSLAGGRAMLEHVRHGGRPYDVRGNHIAEIVSEMAVLSRFNRAQHRRVFEGVTQELVESAKQYYQNLQETMKHLGSPRGYQAYFEAWAPDQVGEAEALVENLRDLFVEQTLDARIEAALPTLAKIQQQGNNMKEAQIFENWINNLSEGTWALPETPEQQEKLNQLMSAELIVGPDATNATELLYDIVGDDELFDILNDLADKSQGRANIWDDSDVQRRLAELGVQTPQSTQAQPANVAQDTAPPAVPPVAEGFGDTITRGIRRAANAIIPGLEKDAGDYGAGKWDKNTNTNRNNLIDWITLNQLDYYEDELLDYFDKFVDGGGSEYKAGEQAVNTWKARMKRDGESVSKPPMAEGEMDEAVRAGYVVPDWKHTQQQGAYGAPTTQLSRPYTQAGRDELAAAVKQNRKDNKDFSRSGTPRTGAKSGSFGWDGVWKAPEDENSRVRAQQDNAVANPKKWKMIPSAGDGKGVAEGDNMATFEEDRELAEMLKYAGVPVKESVLTDSTGSTLEHIKDTFRRDVKDFTQSGDMSDALYDALYDYYFDDMPYGTKKARTGDPHEWVANRFAQDIGLDEGWKGALAGGLAGAGLGSVVPALGTVAGGIAGAYAGHKLGDQGFSDPDKEWKKPQQQQQQKPVAEGSCNMTMEGSYCPEHGLAECGSMYEDGGAVGMPYSMGEAQAPQDPINSNSAMTGSYYEGKETDIQEGDALLARIKSLALLR
jgi:hypothetical protein